jgi:CD109 antigen
MYIVDKFLMYFYLKVDLEANPMETQPGANVDITIRSKPNSYVGLLGVDQSVLLLKSGNDLTMVKLLFY